MRFLIEQAHTREECLAIVPGLAGVLLRERHDVGGLSHPPFAGVEPDEPSERQDRERHRITESEGITVRECEPYADPRELFDGR